jgi:hypothetical protein
MLLVAFMLLAFVFQGYATQTHIHVQNVPAAVHDVKGGAGHDKYPPNDDPANCPICQQIMQAGHYVAPAWLMPLLILQTISAIEIVTVTGPRNDAVSHNWRSRGPPQH